MIGRPVWKLSVLLLSIAGGLVAGCFDNDRGPTRSTVYESSDGRTVRIDARGVTEVTTNAHPVGSADCSDETNLCAYVSYIPLVVPRGGMTNDVYRHAGFNFTPSCLFMISGSLCSSAVVAFRSDVAVTASSGQAGFFLYNHGRGVIAFGQAGVPNGGGRFVETLWVHVRGRLLLGPDWLRTSEDWPRIAPEEIVTPGARPL